MARSATIFVCQSCGATASRWAGQCAACGAWNSLSEEAGAAPAGGKRARAKKPGGVTLLRLDESDAQIAHAPTGIGEFDRVVGGGLVPGSGVLLGGDPGIGKSTLLLQTAATVASAGRKALYFSGEEAADQIALRAERLGLASAPLRVAAETNVERILATLDAQGAGDLVIIDSIQTLWSDALDSAPGTVSQVRACAHSLIAHAKRTGCAMFLVGHVTKDGQIAGPKVVEHMVDTVLYFEGDSAQHYRLLRSVKNRFGPAGEIGVFEMRGDGLRPVGNPSQLFLGERGDTAPGAAVFAGIEGTRPLLVEIQALVAPTAFPSPRRAVVGWDANRLAMLLAVLEARCGTKLSGHDVYLNVAGGLRVGEPAADLAVAAALVSALSGVALDTDCVYFGEVSLSGAIRPVRLPDTRLREAAKLGFSAAIVPASVEFADAACGLRVERIGHLNALAAHLSGAGKAARLTTA